MMEDLSELGGAHASNCVADFMETSWSSRDNRYGWSWFSDVPASFVDYVNLVAPEYGPTASNYRYVYFPFSMFMEEINNGRPVVLLVDSDGNGSTDHFITAIGYEQTSEMYACLNTWDGDVHWYPWRQMSSSYSWGIYGATTFDFIGQQPCCELRGDADRSGDTDPMDAVYFVNYLWLGGPQPPCMDEVDVDGNGDVNPLDAIYLVNWLWQGGPAPVPCP